VGLIGLRYLLARFARLADYRWILPLCLDSECITAGLVETVYKGLRLVGLGSGVLVE
jgi:hypothetical protein